MANKRKIRYIVIPIVTFAILNIVLFVVFEYQLYKKDKRDEQISSKVEATFIKYDNDDNIADITDLYIYYNNYETTFNDHIYDDDQIIFTPEKVVYLYDEGFFSTNFKIYSRDVIYGSEKLLYTTRKMKNSSIKIETFDNCFYIKYDIWSEKNIVDVYDVDERRYYNYSKGEDVSLDDIVYEEQKKKYKMDITISEDERTIIIKNMETNETHIIDDELIMNSEYKEDMSKFEYKVGRAYISYGHILLIYLIGMDGRFTSTVIYEYSFDNNSIRFVFFDNDRYVDERYEYIDSKQ